MEFKPWPKIPRVENRKEYYTEKIDGTNACIIISFEPADENTIATNLTEVGPISMWAQSRSQFITPNKDNYGFARWAANNATELFKLGEGYHFGEWWGLGIQRGYNQTEKKFSLFNTHREAASLPACVSQVPTIHANSVEEAKEILITGGSLAAPGFMNVEGVVIFEYNTKTYWKAIIYK